MTTTIILSGGMDSATLLYELIEDGHYVEAIAFDYNQRHNKELECAKWLCEKNNVPLKIIDMTAIFSHVKGNSQTDSNVEVPEGRYDEESMKKTVVPNRNMLMLAAAASIAISKGSTALAYGAHAGDHAIYPDCRPQFVEAMKTVLGICDWAQLELLTPYLHLTKGDICKRGLILGVPYEHTWTCYAGKETPCGKCGSCTERAEAFEYAGATDPLIGEQKCK